MKLLIYKCSQMTPFVEEVDQERKAKEIARFQYYEYQVEFYKNDRLVGIKECNSRYIRRTICLKSFYQRKYDSRMDSFNRLHSLSVG